MLGSEARFRGFQKPVLEAIIKPCSPISSVMATEVSKSAEPDLRIDSFALTCACYVKFITFILEINGFSPVVSSSSSPTKTFIPCGDTNQTRRGGFHVRGLHVSS